MPCPITNQSPAEGLIGRQLRTTLDRLHPNYAPETPIDLRGRIKAFDMGAKVYARTYARNLLWLPGKIIRINGPYSYEVELEDGRSWRLHINQLRGRERQTIQNPVEQFPPGAMEQTRPITAIEEELSSEATTRNQEQNKNLPENSNPPLKEQELTSVAPQVQDDCIEERPQPVVPTEVVLRRSSRARRPPDYLRDYACASLGGKECHEQVSTLVRIPRGH